MLHASLFELETAAATTYTAGLGEIIGTDPAAIVASIQPIEARHAAVLGEALDLRSTSWRRRSSPPPTP